MSVRVPDRTDARGARYDSAHPIVVSVALFALALAFRVLFWVAFGQGEQAYSAFYKGDAGLWVAYARALADGAPFELGLPLRPPGMAYLLAALGVTGDTFGWQRLAFCALGALVPPLFYLGIRHGVGEVVARWAAGFTCAATGLILLSSSLNNETPYLVLVTASLCGIDRLRARGGAVQVALWSGVQGLACLVRVEHALFYALCTAWLARGWWGRGRRAAAVRIAGSLCAFAVVLAPWHAQAWGAVRAFNTEVQPAMQRATLAWQRDASSALDQLPGFARSASAAFVEACVRHRGGRTVRLEDLGILDEAYEYRPEPLAAHPFVALYGPLNFYLANRGGDGGFSRAPLVEPPPLHGGREKFDPIWLANLPLREELALQYPPHLRLVNRGYALGIAEIAARPGEWLVLVGRKLERFWAGAARGLGGIAMPTGLSGPRGRVDMVRADGGWLWQLLVLLLCGLGLARAARCSAAWPWLLWLASKLAVTVLFFGYARQGALAVPAVALAVAFAIDRTALDRLGPAGCRRAAGLGLALLAALLIADAARALSPPEVLVGGRVHALRDPWPAFEFEERRVEVR